ncbi:MAG: phosphatase PAP2 family protein [Hyphomicrobiaceae bacterium]
MIGPIRRALSDPTGLVRRVLGVPALERDTLVAIVSIFVLLLFFGVVAEAVEDGFTREIDSALLLALRVPGNTADPIGPAWVEEGMRDISAMGSTSVLTFITLAVVGYLAFTRRGHAALMVLGSVLSGTFISQLLKVGFARPRPDLVPHATEVFTASFPSGHAMMSAVVYLTLGTLLARTESRRRVKSYVMAVAAVLTMLVGLSRIYLGVHWPSDVVAGWALGAGWAALAWLVMLWLQDRGKVEQEGLSENGGDGQPGA